MQLVNMELEEWKRDVRARGGAKLNERPRARSFMLGEDGGGGDGGGARDNLVTPAWLDYGSAGAADGESGGGSGAGVSRPELKRGQSQSHPNVMSELLERTTRLDGGWCARVTRVSSPTHPGVATPNHSSLHTTPDR